MPFLSRFTLFPILILLLVTGSNSYADTFLLRNGKIVEGTAKEEGNVLKITTYSGKEIKISKTQLAGRIEEPIRNQYHLRASKLKPDDSNGHFQLGQWARLHSGKVKRSREQKALLEAAKIEFEKTLKADPNHDGAGKALGWTKKDGRWSPAQRAGPKPAKVEGTQNQKEIIFSKNDLLKKLKTPAAAGNWIDGNSALELVAMAKKSPQSFFPLLIAPGWPKSANIRDPEIRARVAQVLGQSGHRNAMDTLGQSCLQDPSDEVREASAKALPNLGEPIAMRKMISIAINRKFKWKGKRRLACIALRRWADKEIIERLLSELSYELAAGNPLDPQNPLRRPKGGIGTDNPLAIPDNTPQPTSDKDDTYRYPVLTAMKEITGHEILDGSEKDVKAWKKWWLENEAAFQFSNK